MTTLIRVARPISAWLFDLDGVLTDTATLHDRAWKEVFDGYLSSLDPPARPFDARDYERFVDGKPHTEGVRDFLASRGIELPNGAPSDPPGSASVAGIARVKDAVYFELLASEGVNVFPDAIELLDRVQEAGTRSAVVTASEHCSEVLESAGLGGRFDVQVDGKITKSRGFRGKPSPDTYLYAASLLDTTPARAAVVEDALAGVEAGRAGRFGLVVGVARCVAATALSAAGAGIVVDELTELLEENRGGPGTDR